MATPSADYGNTTQVRRWLPLVVALALSACHTPSPYASFGGMPLTPLRPDSALFTSADGRLFLRLPFREVNEDKSHDPPYDFFEYMYRFDDLKYHLLAEVLDVRTFRRVPGTSSWYCGIPLGWR